MVGILLGLAGGYFLHLLTIRNAEAGIVMYVQTVNPWSYLWSISLTTLFTIMVIFTANAQLRRLKIVDSLKSIE